jgi:hypothetical protein
MTGRRPVVDYDDEGPFIRLVDAAAAANPGWWEAAANGTCSHGGHDWDGETCDDAPAAACPSCSRGNDGGGYPCDCPEACGARYCQHPTETNGGQS